MRFSTLSLALGALLSSAATISIAQIIKAPTIANLQGFDAIPNRGAPSFLVFDYENEDPKAPVRGTRCSRYIPPYSNETLVDDGTVDEFHRYLHACDDPSVQFSLKEGYLLLVRVQWPGVIDPKTGSTLRSYYAAAWSDTWRPTTHSDAPGTVLWQETPVTLPVRRAVG